MGTEISFHNLKRCDLILINLKKEICLIIEIKFEKSSKIDLHQIFEKKYEEILKLTNIKSLKTFILLGINFNFLHESYVFLMNL